MLTFTWEERGRLSILKKGHSFITLSDVAFPKGKHAKKIRLASLGLESQRNRVPYIEFYGEKYPKPDSSF